MVSGYPKSGAIAYITIFAAASIALAFSRVEIPYPLLPYLKFDFAEVPVVLALMFGGLPSGLATALIYWIGLSIARGWVLGPLMKFLAIVPMIFGFWLGMRTLGGKSIFRSFALAFPLGMTIRVVVCAIANVIVLLFIAPDFLKFSAICLRTLGINVASEMEALSWTLIFNAIFNALHATLSATIAVVVFVAVAKRIPSVVGKALISLK